MFRSGSVSSTVKREARVVTGNGKFGHSTSVPVLGTKVGVQLGGHPQLIQPLAPHPTMIPCEASSDSEGDASLFAVLRRYRDEQFGGAGPSNM